MASCSSCTSPARYWFPLALALLFSFLLGPVVRRLERHGFATGAGGAGGRRGSFFCCAALLGWLMVSQVVELAGRVPGYQGNIQHKLEALHGGMAARSRPPRKSSKSSRRTRPNPSRPTRPAPKGGGPAAADRGASTRSPSAEATPQPVRVIEPPASPPQFLRNLFGPLLGPLSLVGIVVIFTVFILIQREDLRDRIVHLAGPGAPAHHDPGHRRGGQPRQPLPACPGDGQPRFRAGGGRRAVLHRGAQLCPVGAAGDGVPLRALRRRARRGAGPAADLAGGVRFLAAGGADRQPCTWRWN